MNDGRTGLECWLNMERPCSAECMSYLDSASVPEGEDYKRPDGVPMQWAHCMVLVNLHRVAKHSVHLASSVGGLVRLKKQEAGDRARMPPLEPMP